MHFVGMLAFSLPGIEISYDPFLTFLSLVIPIVVAAAAFAVVGRRPRALLGSGFAMGLGISGMHYTGMGAMRMAASIEYDPQWVVLSIMIAISASVVALWLAFRHTSAVQRLFAGVVMGLAVSGMHYAAMEGALFLPAMPVAGHAGHVVGQAPLAFLLAGTTIVILSIGIAAAVYDRASAERAQREASALRRSEERFRLLVEGITDHAIFMLEPDGRVGNWNLGARRLMGYGDDIVRTSYAIFHTEEDRAAETPARALLAAEREGKSAIEGWRVRKDGSRFWAEATIVAARREEQDGGGPTSRYVALAVRDTGCGMDDETREHAQEPFFTTKGIGKGTGLGLSMVHGLAEQSGGRLVLKSRLREGTTAEIWLPIAEESAVPAARAAAPSPIPQASRRLSVLVVDD